MVSADDAEPVEDAESLPVSLSVKVESRVKRCCVLSSSRPSAINKATARSRVTAAAPPAGAGGRGTTKSLAAGTTAGAGMTKSLVRK
jgi:hypothetical protein